MLTFRKPYCHRETAWCRCKFRYEVYKHYLFDGFQNDRLETDISSKCCIFTLLDRQVVSYAQSTWWLIIRGVATGGISGYIPQKSAQVNFLSGKNDIRTAIQQFYTPPPPKKLYTPKNKFLATPLLIITHSHNNTNHPIMVRIVA